MKKIILFCLMIMGFTFTLLSPTVLAGSLDPCSNASNTKICQTSATSLTGGILTNVINTLLLIAGVVAVIMIIVGGIRYITSDGDSNKANQAKNTIIYAVIGVVVSVMSYSIVNFVIGRF